MKKKIAFIIQLYGLDVNGGAEYHCRMIAERLKDLYDVEVITSCAKDFTTWADAYDEGISYINEVKVRRFSSGYTRDRRRLMLMTRKLKKKQLHQKVFRFLGLLNLFEKIVPAKIADDDYEKWVQYQGPYLPGLVEYLKDNHHNYDALIFFTYLYYPAIYGINVAPEKSILIPTAHDEWPIYFPLFKKFFNTPRVIFYNTLSEKRFITRLFNNEHIYSDIAGVGVEMIEPVIKYSVKDILKTDDDYLIYIGRVDVFKGCKLLCDYFLKYKSDTNNKNIKLVFAGKVFMEVPVNKDIIFLGFVNDDVKITLLQNAKALVIPSLYESLSLVTLESMAYGVPVIANEQCEVLKDHIANSNAGFLFNDFSDFKKAVDMVLAQGIDFKELAERAKKYVRESYTWEATIKKYQKAINYINPH